MLDTAYVASTIGLSVDSTAFLFGLSGIICGVFASIVLLDGFR